MTDVRITTTRGTDIVLDDATVQGFQTSLRGSLLRSGDAGYDAARKVWNANIDKPASPHRPLRWRLRRDQRGQLRPHQHSAGVGARRWP